MIWVYPVAAIALVALAAPILLHVLVRQRAARVAFPTLRFIQPHRLASVRRRALEDGALLLVRAAIFVLAVGAIAGPFLVTAARRRAWDARTIRAEVSDPDLHSGLIRAVAWLDRQPPGRREIVVRAPLPIGSVTATDIAAIPPRIGVRFERRGGLPPTRAVPAIPVVHDTRVIEREMMLNGDRTSVRDVGTNGVAAPAVEMTAPADQQPAVDRLRAAVSHERFPVAAPSRSAHLVFGSTVITSATVSEAWIADAAAAIARDTGAEIDLAFGSEGNRLVVTTAMSAADARAPALVRAVARSLAPSVERPGDEIVPIPDAQLTAWTREPGPANGPTPEMLDGDDRRWLWGAVLMLLLVETWIRRERHSTIDAKDSARAA